MLTKIIAFPQGHFKRKKQPPLSLSMIVTLLAACAKQKKRIHFGPSDIKGSCSSLITRGLIVRKDITVNKHTESLWQVTNEAMLMLKALGIEVPC